MNKGPERVIFVPFITAFGGVERLVLALAGYLHEKNIKSEILCFKNSISLENYASFPIRIAEVLSPRNSVIEGWLLSRYLKKHLSGKIDALLVFDLKGAFYAGMFLDKGYSLHLTDPPSLLPSDISKHAPSIWNKNCFSFKHMRSELAHWLNKRGVRRAGNVICMTESIREELSELYGVSPEVVRPGVTPARNINREHKETGSIHFLTVSRLEKNKRLDWILKALSNLSVSNIIPPNWNLDLVGSGPEDKHLKKLAEKYEIEDRVEFHGKVPDNELEDLYAKASIFLMPAIQGYGLPALEALMRGVPVVVNKESGVSEIFGKSPWASIFSQEEDLEKSIIAMLGNMEEGKLNRSNLPSIPTASNWAGEVEEIWSRSHD